MPKVAKDPHKHAGAKAADPLGTSPKPSTAVVGTATVVARPGRLSFKDGQTMVSTEFDDDYFGAAFTSCRNGPGKKVIMGMSNDGVFSTIFEGTFKDGSLEGPGTLTIDGQGFAKPVVQKGVFKNHRLEGLGTSNGREMFFKEGKIVRCLTPSFFGTYFSGNKTELLEHYTAITGTPAPAGGRFMKQMRRALIDEHYSAEHLRALGNCFSVAGWSENASADLAGLRTMLKSSTKIAKLL
jgi:hypothetical protein